MRTLDMRQMVRRGWRTRRGSHRDIRAPHYEIRIVRAPHYEIRIVLVGLDDLDQLCSNDAMDDRDLHGRGSRRLR